VPAARGRRGRSGDDLLLGAGLDDGQRRCRVVGHGRVLHDSQCRSPGCYLGADAPVSRAAPTGSGMIAGVIHGAARQKGEGPILGVRPGSGRPGPFGVTSGFGLDDDSDPEVVAELGRAVDEAVAAGMVQAQLSPRSPRLNATSAVMSNSPSTSSSSSSSSIRRT
jgi:hypothetical protein